LCYNLGSSISYIEVESLNEFVMLTVILFIIALWLFVTSTRSMFWMGKANCSVGDWVGLHLEDDDYLAEVTVLDPDNDIIVVKIGDKSYKMTLQQFRERVYYPDITD